GQEGHSWQCLRCPVVRCRPHSRLCTGGAGLLRAAVGLAEYAHAWPPRSEEHTSELQSLTNLVCRLLLEKKNNSADEKKDNTLQHPADHGKHTTSPCSQQLAHDTLVRTNSYTLIQLPRRHQLVHHRLYTS